MCRPLACLFFVAGLTACGDSEPTQAPPAPVAAPEVEAPAPVVEAPKAEAEEPAGDDPALALKGDVTAGEAVYKANCIACHQADGTGMGGALGADFVNDKARLAKSDAVLLDSIANGVEGTTMIGWKAMVDDQGRADVLAYMRSAFGGQG